VLVLGKHFNVRVQVQKDARLVIEGPYSYIRHPSYTGMLLILVGLGLSIGTWLGALIALAATLIAHEYRIRIEEDVLQKAFGPDYEDYKKRTWKLFPGF
jgi:protein-S-isoprenylcysteine O-methyltransferase Ste14